MSKPVDKDKTKPWKQKYYRVDFSDVEIDIFFGISDNNGDGTISIDVSPFYFLFLLLGLNLKRGDTQSMSGMTQ